MPPICEPFITSRDSALAACSRSAGTIFGSNAVDAGQNSAIPLPVTNSSPTIPGRPIECVRVHRPKPPSPSAINRLPNTMTDCGLNRSAATPPKTMNKTEGTICAATTYDRSAVEAVTSSTANDTPTIENAYAIGASSRSASSMRKSRYRSRSRLFPEKPDTRSLTFPELRTLR